MAQATRTDKPTNEAEAPGVALRQPLIGEVVLFCVQERPLTFRPLIVTSPGSPVRGLLFFEGDEDRHLPWVQRWSKVTPGNNNEVTWVRAYHGHGEGEWRFQEED